MLNFLVWVIENDAQRLTDTDLQEKSEEEATRKLMNQLNNDNKEGWERCLLTALRARGSYIVYFEM